MTTNELKQYIDKTLGNSIRCLLPSYWWKRLFGMVVDEVDKVSTKTATLNSEFKSEVKNINSEVAELKSKAKENYLLYIGDNLTEYEIQFNKETVKILRSLIAHDDNAFYRFDYNEFCNLIVYVEYNDRYYPCVPLTVFIHSSTGWLCVVCTYPDGIIDGNKAIGVSKIITYLRSSGKIFSKEIIDGNIDTTAIATLESKVIDNEEVTAAALTQLNTTKQDALVCMLPDIVSNEFLFLGGDFSIANINDALLMLESDMPELKEVSELIFNNMISNNISIYEKIVNNAIDNNGVTMLVDFSKTYPILDSLLGEYGISSESIIHTVKVIKNGEDIQVKFYNTTSENDDFGKIVYELKSTGEVIYSKYDLVLPHNGANLSDEIKKANAEALIYIEDARLPKSMVNLYLIDVNNTLHNISTIIATSTSYDSNLNPTYIIDFINPVSYSIDKASIHNDGAVEIATSASLTAIL